MSTFSSAHSYMSPPRGDSVHDDLQSDHPQSSDIETPRAVHDSQEEHPSESESPTHHTDPSSKHRRFYSLNYAPTFIPNPFPHRNTYSSRKGYRSSVILNPIYEEGTHGNDLRYGEEIYFGRPNGSHTYTRGFIFHHDEDERASYRTATPDYSRHSGMRPESLESFPYYTWSSRASSFQRPIVVPPVVITAPPKDMPWQPPHMPFFFKCPPPKPASYMWFAIIVAMVFNVLFGLIAIHFSLVSKFEWKRGNVAAAKRNGLRSRNVALAGILTTVIFLFIILVCLAGFGILEFPDVILL
ncbi:uncharacterized protein LOC106173636 [Lingula anatina]|uniref:Uncharacterized protein LOC106173636 n=1 Tax=Lingula anatina TaxID=7574 RepID=A0A1S3JIP2_LINAN|nr:uncharacterized protein LOC106173636 [Lingula anatina]|eukprot:XP_013410280.2 uncharacterized protein LOC106173636 [Lingula anatina]